MANVTDRLQDRLSLRSSLSEMNRIPSWVEGLLPQDRASPDLISSINLCLEEIVSNVIRHGYWGKEDGIVTVQFNSPREKFYLFEVEDQAPHFNPLAAPELPGVSASKSARVGGQGIRFVRRFADSIEYEATPSGNKLRIGFADDGKNRGAA